MWKDDSLITYYIGLKGNSIETFALAGNNQFFKTFIKTVLRKNFLLPSHVFKTWNQKMKSKFSLLVTQPTFLNEVQPTIQARKKLVFGIPEEFFPSCPAFLNNESQFLFNKQSLYNGA